MICYAVQKLIDYAIKNELITSDDIYVVRNQLIETLKLSDWEENNTEYSGESIDELLLPLIRYACENGIISDTANSRDLFDTKLMGILTPMPREVIAEFKRRYAAYPKEATDWYFGKIWGEMIEMGMDGVKIDFCEVMPEGEKQIGITKTHGIFSGRNNRKFG